MALPSFAGAQTYYSYPSYQTSYAYPSYQQASYSYQPVQYTTQPTQYLQVSGAQVNAYNNPTTYMSGYATPTTYGSYSYSTQPAHATGYIPYNGTNNAYYAYPSNSYARIYTTSGLPNSTFLGTYGNTAAYATYPRVSATPSGTTDMFGTPLCYWGDYSAGATPCSYDPQQWVLDPYTGRWY